MSSNPPTGEKADIVERLRKRFDKTPDSNGELMFLLNDAAHAVRALREKLAGADQAFVKAIDNEPEFPGSMPDEMWTVLRNLASRNDREGMEYVMRSVVIATKHGIRARAFPTPPAAQKEQQ